MTDPRIEAAVWMIGSVSYDTPGGDWEKLAPHQKEHYRRLAKITLEEADNAAWRPIASAPKDGRGILAAGTQKADAVSDPVEFMDIVWFHYGLWQDGSIACRPTLTHWQPLPKPPTPRE